MDKKEFMELQAQRINAFNQGRRGLQVVDRKRALSPISNGTSTTWWVDPETNDLYKRFPPVNFAGTEYIRHGGCIRKVTKRNIRSMNIPQFVQDIMVTVTQYKGMV